MACTLVESEGAIHHITDDENDSAGHFFRFSRYNRPSPASLALQT